MLSRIIAWMRGWTCPSCQHYNSGGVVCKNCGMQKPK